MEKRKQNKIFFSEEQRFSESPMKWALPAIFMVSVGPLAYGMYQQFVLGKPWGDNPTSNLVLMLIFGFVAVFIGVLWIAFLKSRLEVTVDAEGIHYRFPLFIRKIRSIEKEQIARYEVRKYSPLMEYGGWGYKKPQGYYRRKNGIAVNVKGNIGLQLYLANGKKILIGTQRPEAMKRAMKRLMDENEQLDD